MRYFTAEQLVRLQDHSDRKRFLVALESWEGALAAYRERWHEIRGQLPSRLRRLLDSVALHDAQVVDMWQNQSRFNITLLPESEPSKLVVLGYRLAEPARIDREALPQAVRSMPVAWLYDELDVMPAPSSGPDRLIFGHNILLSNGWELGLRFHSVAVTRPHPLLPGASPAGIGSASVSPSA